MFRLFHDEINDGIQALPASEMERGDPRSEETWHRLLLQTSPSSSRFSFISEVPTDAGSQPSTPRQMRHGIFGEQDESATNYDSGNFSFSDSAGKEKLVPAHERSGGDLHQRFVQLNTELYQTKTELLTYKYKWNEIRNEVELNWRKKLDKLCEEKNDLVLELEDVCKQITRLKETPVDCIDRELLRIRTHLRDVTVGLECEEKANESLKQKIAKQYVEQESLHMRIRDLEQRGFEKLNEMCRVKASERWFREELHRCQNENTKLKESYAVLDNIWHTRQAQPNAVVVPVQNVDSQGLRKYEKLFSTINPINDPNEQAKETEHSIKHAENKKANLKNAHFCRESYLLRNIAFLERQNNELHTVIWQLQQTLKDQHKQTEALAKREKEALHEISQLRDAAQTDDAFATMKRYRTEIETLSAQLARECFNKRQIDASVEKLKAQVKVLSISLATRPCQRSTVEKCTMTSLRQCNQELQKEYSVLLGGKYCLESDLPICGEVNKPQYNQLLLDNSLPDFFQSKTLGLQQDLGQCVTVRGKREEVAGELEKNDMIRLSLTSAYEFKEGLTEPLANDFLAQSIETGKDKNAKKVKMVCPKHGVFCHVENLARLTDPIDGSDEDDEIRNLRIWLKAIESEHRRRLKRYEVNNRTLLQKVKEYAHERNQARQRVEELEKEHAKCAKLRCEMASAREQHLLLEADLATSQQEAWTLRTEKENLIFLLENNCLLTSDRDIWISLKKAFKELRKMQQVHNENKYLQQLLETNERKIEQLEKCLEGLPLAADVQKSEADEVRSALSVKTLQLEDSLGTVHRLVGENAFLHQSIATVAETEQDVTKKFAELNCLVGIDEIRLHTANERLKLYEESERVLKATKDTLFADLQSLHDAIMAEKQEKFDLEEEVHELRQNMANAVGNSLQNFHPTESVNSGSGQQSATINTPDPQSLAWCSASLDIDHLHALVKQCSRERYSLQPLHESVSSLKLEMDHLNFILHHGNYSSQQQHQQMLHQQPRFPLSLMDELNDATNGHYGSR